MASDWENAVEPVRESEEELSVRDGYAVAWLVHAMPAPLPIPDAVFDLAVLGLVAEHVANLGGLFAEVVRVLRPGGRCLLSAFHEERTAGGQRARFIDPQTGVRRPI